MSTSLSPSLSLSVRGDKEASYLHQRRLIAVQTFFVWMDGVAECPPLERGLTLGQWELGRKLGQGAFGEVFEGKFLKCHPEKVVHCTLPNFPATHAKLPGTFALKTCRISRGKGEKKVKSTTQSQGAVALAVERRAYVIQLKGVPNLPELPPSNYGDDKGYRYLAMQKMAEDLKTRVASVGGRLSPAAVAYVGNAVVRLDFVAFYSSSICCSLITTQLETFQAAHLKGYMYFDLKPANVMLTAAGEVRVLDWGCCSSYKDFRGDMLENGRDAGNDTFRSLHSHAQSRNFLFVALLLHVVLNGGGYLQPHPHEMILKA